MITKTLFGIPKVLEKEKKKNYKAPFGTLKILGKKIERKSGKKIERKSGRKESSEDNKEYV